MSCGTCCSPTLGGTQFNSLAATSGVINRGSTNATGRHGTSNIWSKWPKTGQNKSGITARAPYNIGTIKTPASLGGGRKHETGLNLGTHGHGIGVVPAAIGGSRNARTRTVKVSKGNVGSAGGKTLTPQPSRRICFKCFSFWAVVGVIVFGIAVITGR